MKKLICFLLISMAFISPYKKAHAIDAKSKAFLIMCTYGTVGGALLGFASLSFGSNSRAIAQGASLGLYAGIAFGSYVVLSHNKAGQSPPMQDGYGYPAQDPYYNGYGQEPAGGGYGTPPPPSNNSGGGFFGSPQRMIEIQNDLASNYKLKNEKGRDFSLPLYVNFYNASF